MDFDIGIACGQCDTYSPMGTVACAACGNDLAFEGRRRPKAQPRGSVQALQSAQTPPARHQLSEEELMEQARNYVCKECSTAVPSGHKFCGTCGAGVPPEVVELRINYFGSMQTPGKARLILIRGDSGVDGLSYMLQGTEHIAGRDDGQILFPEDSWLSPRHANFVYEGGTLVVRDEGSYNGVYFRVRGALPIGVGDTFLCGEQLFRLDAAPPDGSAVQPDQTYFYHSPRKPSAYRLVQLLAGGGEGLVACALGPALRIGREECELNFPTDVFMSGVHASVEMGPDGGFTLTDQDSKNGTYVRIRGTQPLHHGDYLFLGKQLLRVEMTA